MTFKRFSTDRRQFQRIVYDADATLIGPDGFQTCRICDLSLKGCMLEFSDPWKASAEPVYTLRIALSAAIQIDMQIALVREYGHHIGFRCVHIDLESISQLRRLIELNLGDRALLERDLNSLAQVR